jgi:hypothetical protein
VAAEERALRTMESAGQKVDELYADGVINASTRRFLHGYIEHGFYSPMSTGGYGMSDELRAVVRRHFK